MAIREASPLGHHSTLPAGGRVPGVCQESGPPEPPKPRLLDRVRHAIETTMIYTHVLNRGPAGVRSPADRLVL
jgi:hypothetical protein